MLTAVKNQIKVSYLTTKYALMREMINKATFLMNVTFMILNNSTFLIQWLVLYSLKDNIGGYTFKQIILLWGIAAATYGVSHFFFENAQNLSEMITNGKLDSFLVQPKNVLLTTITSNVTTSAIGDYIFGIIAMIISGFTIPKFILFVIISFTGGIIITDFAVILGSLSFWFGRADMIADTGNRLMTQFATYPDGIFKGLAKALLFILIPVGITAYVPLWILIEFKLHLFLIIIAVTIIVTALAFFIFYKGLKRYSSSNLMIAKI